MKVRILILSLLLVCLLCGMVAASGEGQYVYDGADVLTSKEEKALNQKLAKWSETISMDILAVTIEKANVTRNDAYDYFRKYSRSENGVILLLGFSSSYGNTYYIQSVGEVEQIFDEKALDRAENAFFEELKSGEYKAAFQDYGQKCYEIIRYDKKLSPAGIVFCVLVGVVLSFLIPMKILKGQLKTVRSQPAAASYVKKNSMNLTKSSDTFLYRNVSRVAKAQKSSSGGGSRSGGGGGGGGRGGRF